MSDIRVSISWPQVSYCVTSGNIQVARFREGLDGGKNLVIVEITPQEIERVIADLEVAAIMAKEAPDAE